MKQIFLIVAYCLLFIAYCFPQGKGWWWRNDDGAVIDTVGLAYTSAYIDRVETDGGEVIDSAVVNQFYKDAITNNYLDTLTVALLFDTGVKLSGAVITKWYDLSHNDNDFATYYGLNPNYSETDGVGGGTTPDFGASLTFNQPNSYYFIMMRTTSHTSATFWGAGSDQLCYESSGGIVVINAGTDLTGGGYTEDNFDFVRCIFNGAASSVQINAVIQAVGNAGAQNQTGDLLLFGTIEDTYFKCFIITPMLSSTKDLSLKNILNTIYPTY